MTSRAKIKIRRSLWLKEENLKLNFDLYTRNYYIAKFIQAIGASSLKVLDVGGRGGLLKNFLNSTTDLTVLDLMKNDFSEKNYIVGNILDSKIPDRSFDVVTSSDLLEHINEKDRPRALKEMFRISKDLVIIAAPFYSDNTERTERAANEFYKRLYDEDHPWLKEHFESVLPKKENLENFLGKNNYQYYSIGSNNLDLWELMQYFIFFCSKFSPGREKYYDVIRFYNEDFHKLGDSLEPTYRSIYFISKNNSLNRYKKIEAKTRLDISVLLQLIKLIMVTMNDAIVDYQKNITKRLDYNEDQVRKLTEENNQLTSELSAIYQSRSWKLASRLRSLKKKVDLFKRAGG